MACLQMVGQICYNTSMTNMVKSYCYPTHYVTMINILAYVPQQLPPFNDKRKTAGSEFILIKPYKDGLPLGS